MKAEMMRKTLLIIPIILLLIGCKGEPDGTIYETHSDISDSCVHIDTVLIPVRTKEVEHTKNCGLTAVNIDLMDVWELGEYLYGIDYETTTRMLKLISYEAYPDDQMLDYYCALACVTRALYPEDFMGSNIYERFGEQDTSYGLWMDELAIQDHSYQALRWAYLDFHYINQCNGMATPENYIYYSELYGIYVWNP